MGSQIWITTTETDNFLKNMIMFIIMNLKNNVKN